MHQEYIQSTLFNSLSSIITDLNLLFLYFLYLHVEENNSILALHKASNSYRPKIKQFDDPPTRQSSGKITVHFKQTRIVCLAKYLE